MKKTWDWLKKWGAALLGGLLVLVGAGWLWRRRSRRLGRIKDELAVARARRELEVLRGRREEIAQQVGEHDVAVEVLDNKLAENQRKIVEAHEHGEGLSDEEVADAFAHLGY